MKIFANKQDDEVIEIYAVLSKNQYYMVQSEEAELELPNNTEMTNRAGNRGLYITCYGKKAATELVEGLEASEIPWQETYSGEDVLESLDGGEPKSREEASS